MKPLRQAPAMLLFCLCLGLTNAAAQTNEFTYQGKFSDSGTPSPTYDFEFRLCASESDCPTPLQIKEQLGVSVSNGTFTVKLDFDAAHFTGEDRFLEIRVRRNSGESWTPLNPRQKITSSPYAIKSLNADNAVNATNSTNASNLGGVAANQYLTITNANINYIQNTTATQASSNFNISGDGTLGGRLSANVVNATTQYDLNGLRILRVPVNTSNLFAGYAAGNDNSSGNENSAFGYYAGERTNTGNGNSFFGRFTGRFNTGGSNNSFFGGTTGVNNTTGSANTLIGSGAGLGNTIGSNNTLLGAGANVISPDLSFATAIGAGATVNQNNHIVLGRSLGLDRVVIPGDTLISSNLTVNGTLNGNGSNLSNLDAGNIATGLLPISRGGTGLSSPGAAGSFLRSNGTSWTSSALQASDIPIGSGNYIQNSISQQIANFNIIGNGTISQPGGSFALRILNTSTGNGINTAIETEAVSGPPGFGTGGRFRGGAFGLRGIGDGGSNTATTYGVVGEASGSAGYRVGVSGVSTASIGVVENIGVSGAASGSAQLNIGVFGNAAGGTVGVTTNWSGYFVGNTYVGGSLGVATFAPEQRLSVGGGMNIDQNDANNGSVINTLRFGSASGEAIGSARAELSPNRYGLDFYTGSANRLVITNDGNVGIGTTAPQQPLSIVGGMNIDQSNFNNGSVLNTLRFGNSSGEAIGSARTGSTNVNGLDFYTFAVNRMAITLGGNVGIGTTTPQDRLDVIGIIRFSGLGSAGGIQLCRNLSNQISNCSSSLRYKTNIAPFSGGLSFINQLRPITFDWKAGGSRDVGFGAEEVAKINPLFITYNAQGEIEGVKYDRLSVAFVNAFKEQQQIIERQQKQIDAMKKLVCELKPEAAFCKEEQK